MKSYMYSIPVSLFSQFGISNFSVVIYALKTLLFLSNSIHVVVSCSKSPKNRITGPTFDGIAQIPVFFAESELYKSGHDSFVLRNCLQNVNV